MVDLSMLSLVAFAFCIAGFVKGMVGLGLPTVSLGLLSLFVDLPTAMALLVMPSLVTNIWQAIAGGEFTSLFRRLWLFLLLAVTTVHVGAELFAMVEMALLQRSLGALLLLYALLALVGKTPRLSPVPNWCRVLPAFRYSRTRQLSEPMPSHMRPAFIRMA